MASANLRWTADTAAAEAKILTLEAVIKAIGDESNRSLGKTSKDFDRLGTSAKRSAKDAKSAFKDAETGLLDLGKASDIAGRRLNRGIGARIGGVQFGIAGLLGEVLKFSAGVGGAFQDVISSFGKMVAAVGTSATWDAALADNIAFTEASAVASEQLTVAVFGVAAAAAGAIPPTVGLALAQEGLIAAEAELAAVTEITTAEVVSSEGAMFALSTAIEAIAAPIGLVIGLFVTLFALLAAGPAIIAAVVFIFVALLDVVTTITAVLAGFVAPLTLVAALLGGLGAAFAYVTVQSFKNKVSLDDQKNALDTLKIATQDYSEKLKKNGKDALVTQRALVVLRKAQEDYKNAQQGVILSSLDLEGKFRKLVATLSTALRPEVVKLGEALSTALIYLNNIAKLPLEQAFKNLSTKGVRLFSQFIYGIGNALKKPFRLAIEFAFGKTGQTAQSAVQGWWDSLTGFLFGYTKTHPLFTFGDQFLGGDNPFGLTTTKVKGALDPLVDWFNRQDFTGTGEKWAADIVDGLSHNKKLRGAVERIARAAGKAAGSAFKTALFYELSSISGYIRSAFSMRGVNLGGPIFAVVRRIGITIGSVVGGAWGSVRRAAGVAFGAIARRAGEIWAQIVRFVEQPLSITIDWPSPPSWLSAILPNIGGSSAPSVHPAAGRGQHTKPVTPATGGIITGGIPGRDSVPAMLTPGEIVLNKSQQLSLLRGGTGGRGLHIHLHGGTFVGVPTSAVGKALAETVAPHLARMNARRA